MAELPDLDLECVALLETGDGVEVDGSLVAEVVEQVVRALGLLAALLIPENLMEFECSVLFPSVLLES